MFWCYLFDGAVEQVMAGLVFAVKRGRVQTHPGSALPEVGVKEKPMWRLIGLTKVQQDLDVQYKPGTYGKIYLNSNVHQRKPGTTLVGNTRIV